MLSQADRVNLKKIIKSNQHEVFILSIDEMDAIVKSRSAPKDANSIEQWRILREKFEFSANYTAGALDIVTLTKLVADLGSAGARIIIKNYGGKAHIIIKGYPGLRKVLTGTRYGISNPKVISMGLGKLGAIKAAKTGGILTVVLLTTYRVADYFLTDKITLTQLIGTLATDIVKVGIATGMSISAATFAGGFSIAIGPIFAVVLVGIGATYMLGLIDEKYGLTDRVISGLDDLKYKAGALLAHQKKQLQKVGNNIADSVLDYMLDSARRLAVKVLRGYLHKFTSPSPGYGTSSRSFF